MVVLDVGVTPDYVDRAFRSMEAEAADRGDPKGHLGHHFRTQRVQLADLKAIQEHRPKAPPGRGKNFNYMSPLHVRVLEERRIVAENRRNSL
jgi:hypothetical protein